MSRDSSLTRKIADVHGEASWRTLIILPMDLMGFATVVSDYETSATVTLRHDVWKSKDEKRNNWTIALRKTARLETPRRSRSHVAFECVEI